MAYHVFHLTVETIAPESKEGWETFLSRYLNETLGAGADFTVTTGVHNV